MGDVTVRRPVAVPARRTPSILPLGRPWRRFLAFAAPAALGVAALTTWLGLDIGGVRITNDVSDVGQAVPALIAAMSCGWTAYRSDRRFRRAWALIGASALSWGIGELIWSYYSVVLGVAVPFPSAADAGFLGAIPLAVAGVLAFPSAPSRGNTRLRAVLDGTMVAFSLFFVSWALGLSTVYHQSAASLLAQWIGLAYPVGDVVIGTVLFVAVRRSTPANRGRLLVLLFGLGANAFSDSAFAFLTANGTYGTASNLFDAGWILGYTAVALAPLWPEGPAGELGEEGPLTLGGMILPWLGLLAVALTALALTAMRRPIDQFLVVPGATLVIVLMASQMLSHRDSIDLLMSSRRAESQLKLRTHLLNEIIARAPLGIARVGIDMRVIDANPRLAALLRTEPAHMTGSSVAEFLSPDEFARVYEIFQPLWEGAVDTVESDSKALRADGTEAWLHWSATSVRNSVGRIDYFLAMYEDTDAEHAAMEAAAAHLGGLERLNQLKSEFVSAVSHEFRTALVGIQGFSEMIRDTNISLAEAKGFAADINCDAERLNRLISQMLDLDRMESGRMTLSTQRVDFNRVIDDTVARAAVTTSIHRFVVKLDPDLPSVAGDPDRLFQVMTNLLSNAVKYSPDGGPIEVTSRFDDGQVAITVTDHGLGIPPEYVNRLFGRYERFENNHVGKIIGTGLGLAITRQIVELHGGSIGVESVVGSGSTFRFTIPSRQSEPAAATEAAVEQVV
jgi:two-component system, sensor histidine kinase and response regulator